MARPGARQRDVQGVSGHARGRRRDAVAGVQGAPPPGRPGGGAREAALARQADQPHAAAHPQAGRRAPHGECGSGRAREPCPDVDSEGRRAARGLRARHVRGDLHDPGRDRRRAIHGRSRRADPRRGAAPFRHEKGASRLRRGAGDQRHVPRGRDKGEGGPDALRPHEGRSAGGADGGARDPGAVLPPPRGAHGQYRLQRRQTPSSGSTTSPVPARNRRTEPWKNRRCAGSSTR